MIALTHLMPYSGESPSHQQPQQQPILYQFPTQPLPPQQQQQPGGYYLSNGTTTQLQPMMFPSSSMAGHIPQPPQQQQMATTLVYNPQIGAYQQVQFLIAAQPQLAQSQPVQPQQALMFQRQGGQPQGGGAPMSTTMLMSAGPAGTGAPQFVLLQPAGQHIATPNSIPPPAYVLASSSLAQAPHAHHHAGSSRFASGGGGPTPPSSTSYTIVPTMTQQPAQERHTGGGGPHAGGGPPRPPHSATAGGGHAEANGSFDRPHRSPGQHHHTKRDSSDSNPAPHPLSPALTDPSPADQHASGGGGTPSNLVGASNGSTVSPAPGEYAPFRRPSADEDTPSGSVGREANIRVRPSAWPATPPAVSQSFGHRESAANDVEAAGVAISTPAGWTPSSAATVPRSPAEQSMPPVGGHQPAAAGAAVPTGAGPTVTQLTDEDRRVARATIQSLRADRTDRSVASRITGMSFHKCAVLCAFLEENVDITLHQCMEERGNIVYSLYQRCGAHACPKQTKILRDNFVALAQAQRGCIALPRVLDHMPKEQLMEFFEICVQNLPVLVRHCFANYVVKYFIASPSANRDHVTSAIAARLASMPELVSVVCVDKFGSYVVDELLKKGTYTSNWVLLERLFFANPSVDLPALCNHQYANYIVQSAFDCLRRHGIDTQRYVQVLVPHLQGSPYAPNISKHAVIVTPGTGSAAASA